MTAGPATAEPMLRLGKALEREGRLDDALLIFRHLTELTPQASAPRQALVEALGARGETLEALVQLKALKSVTSDLAGLLPIIQAQSAPAIEEFNRHLQANQLEAAERYAAALVELIPSSPPMIQAAMACNRGLGRTDRAKSYARMLLALEPEHAGAKEILASGQAQPAVDDVRQRLARTLGPLNDDHPLLRLRDIHDLSSYILCHPLTPEGEEQVRALLAAAQELKVEVEPGSDWAGWEKHFRVLLNAIDLDLVKQAAPRGGEPELAYADASGRPLDVAQVKAKARGAGVAFFVAADEAYVDLYARWYVLSLIKYCDVPFVVMVHVIGGAKRLANVAAKVGIDDSRLVFAGDDFDAGAVTTQAFDSPPKGMAAKPIAHFQSVRFQRLGGLLDLLELPVFVSDIDLLLQRGVADLLDSTASADVVLNENLGNYNAGSRLTANLLLVRPTPAARTMMDFLRAYLERSLAKPEVTRWIDQVALILARHHLAYRSPEAKLAYFDTTSDINNVMYTTYQAHPFRFLSLYHGFDTTSLENDPRVLGSGPKA